MDGNLFINIHIINSTASMDQQMMNVCEFSILFCFFPWENGTQAALGYLSSNNGISFDCGGSIIAEYFILTAAHCVRDNRRPVLVRIGKVRVFI